MEELRSTDILDKEIISDANKKAERILLKADMECADILSAVDGRVLEELNKTRKLFENKIQLLKSDCMASVPLEKERYFVNFVQDSIITHINEYFHSLTDEKKIEVCLIRFKKLSFRDVKFNAYSYGFDIDSVKKVLNNILGSNLISVEKTEFNRMLIEDSVLDENKGIILVSDDDEIKCRCTLSEVINDILEEYRQELYDSLFGDIE